MRLNIKTLFLFSLSLMLFLTPVVYAIPGTWRGFALTDGSLASNGVIVDAYINNVTKAANVTVGEVSTWPDGYYLINVEGSSGDGVNFKLCGITVDMPSQSWSMGLHPNATTGSPYINLSVSKLANGASCTYSCACSGGHCCSGATEYNGTGTGNCQDSACAGVTTTTQAGGGGAAGTSTTTTTTTTTVVTTTIPVTTTTLPPVEESKTIASIPAGQSGTFTYTENVAITDIIITTVNAVSNVQVTVKKQSTAPATVAIAAPGVVHSYLTITESNIQNSDIESVTIKFKVEKSWIASNNIDEATIALNRYENNVWTALATSKLSEDANYVYFEVTTTGLSIFAVTGQQVAYPSWILLVIVLVIAAIAIFLVWRRRR